MYCNCKGDCFNSRCGCRQSENTCSLWCNCPSTCKNSKWKEPREFQDIETIIYDMETTGLRKNAKIIEIAFFHPLSNNWYWSLIYQKDVSDEIFDLTGITKKELDVAKSWNVVSDEICAWLQNILQRDTWFL